MHRFRNILVAIHGDHAANGAPALAARLANQEGTSIKLVAVVEDLPWYTRHVLSKAEEMQANATRSWAETLDAIATPLRQNGATVSTEVLHGRPHIELVREVLRGGHDLLIKQAEPNQSLLFGSTDMHLLRTCPCPVWLIKPGHGHSAFSKILAPVDPARPADETDLLGIKTDLTPKDPGLDREILELASSLAASEGAELHVLHAWTAPGEGLLRGDAMLAQEQIERYVQDSREEARKALDQLVATVPDPSGRRSVHLLQGEPEDAIADFAKTGQIDLIVMGTVARSGIGGLLIGNTAETIIQRVDCSVIALKPEGFNSPVKLAD